MADTSDGTVDGAGDAKELRKEAFTMALYVAVCLLAALTAVAERADSSHVEILGLVWGTTIGLALAHLFAFRLSARLVGSGTIDRPDAAAAGAQLLGAAAVAVLGTIPVLVFDSTAELDVTRVLLAGFVAVVGYAVARTSGSSRLRALVYAAVVMAVGLTVAVIKNVLSGH